MPYVKATEKAALKKAIGDAFVAKGVTMVEVGEGEVDNLDVVADAVTTWFAALLPKLTVTVPATGLVSAAPSSPVTGAAQGTIA